MCEVHCGAWLCREKSVVAHLQANRVGAVHDETAASDFAGEIRGHFLRHGIPRGDHGGIRLDEERHEAGLLEECS